MKILCNCGIKYGFDTSPEMVRRPVRFICQSCGADNSDLVNQMIREEYGATNSTATAAAPEPAVAPAPPPTPRPPSIAPSLPSPSRPSIPAPSPVSRVKIAGHGEASASSAASAPSAVAPAKESRYCGKHPGQETSATCLVCHKPMCPLCMQVTGLVCSPFCRTKAEAQGIHVPEYEFQRDITNRKQWRKVSLVAGAIAAVIVAALGFWFWYAWIGSTPRVAYAHRFPDLADSGSMHLASRQQLIVLHGSMLTRHDLESGKLVWSLQLLDTNRIAAESAKEWEAMKTAWAEALKNGADGNSYRLPTLERFTQGNISQAAAALALHVDDQNVWLSSPGKLTRYAWTDGKSEKEITVDESFEEPKRIGQELVFVGEGDGGKESSLRVNLASGDSRAEGMLKAAAATPAGRPGAKTPAATAPAAGPGTKPVDPAAVAARAQNLPKANRIALPATIAAAENQRRLTAAMRNDDEDAPRRPIPRKAPANPEITERVRTADGTIEFSTRLLEERLVQREAMKAAPKKSALDGDVNASATADIANELLNEMQRDRGSSVTEDESRYQVTVRRGQSTQPWTGEVVGAPSLYTLKTIDIVASGKGVLVLDKNNKKLWDAKLNYAVANRANFEAAGDFDGTDDGSLSKGAGPFIERDDVVYVVDQGMLTSFAKASGNVRWRLPSVGITGILFDDQGTLYVNSTTASPDSLKYSKQIDITTKVTSQVLKVDPATGKTLWAVHNEGMVTYISGKLIYTAEASAGDDFDEDEDSRVLGVKTGFEIPPHIRLKRLDAGNGRVLWEHYQKRYPLDVHFDRNTIQLLFKKEVQNLRFTVL